MSKFENVLKAQKVRERRRTRTDDDDDDNNSDKSARRRGYLSPLWDFFLFILTPTGKKILAPVFFLGKTI